LEGGSGEQVEDDRVVVGEGRGGFATVNSVERGGREEEAV
jgi:hypothetical protein